MPSLPASHAKLQFACRGITSLLERSPENRAPESLPETQVQG